METNSSKKRKKDEKPRDEQSVDINFEYDEIEPADDIEDDNETLGVESSPSISVKSTSTDLKENSADVVKKKRKRKRKKATNEDVQKLVNVSKEQEKIRSILKGIFETEARVWIREALPTMTKKQVERMMEGAKPLQEDKPYEAQMTSIVRGVYSTWRELLLKFSLKMLGNREFLVQFIREVIIHGHWRMAIKEHLSKAKAHEIDFDIVKKYKKEFPGGAYESHTTVAPNETKSVNSPSPMEEVEISFPVAIESKLPATVEELEAPAVSELDNDPFGLNLIKTDTSSNILSNSYFTSTHKKRYKTKEELLEELRVISWDVIYFRPKPVEKDAVVTKEIGTETFHFVNYKDFLLPSKGLRRWMYLCEHCPPPHFQEMLATPQEYRAHRWKEEKSSIWPEKAHHSSGDIVLLVVGGHFTGKTTLVRNICRELKTFPPLHRVEEKDVYIRNLPVYERYSNVVDVNVPQVTATVSVLQERRFETKPFEIIERAIKSLGKITLIRSERLWYIIFGHYAHTERNLEENEKEGADSFLFSLQETRKRIALQMMAIQDERSKMHPTARIFFFLEGLSIQTIDFLVLWQSNYSLEPVFIHLNTSSKSIVDRRKEFYRMQPWRAYSANAHDHEIEEQLEKLKSWCDECNIDFLNQKAEDLDELRRVREGLMKFILETNELFEKYREWSSPHFPY